MTSPSEQRPLGMDDTEDGTTRRWWSRPPPPTPADPLDVDGDATAFSRCLSSASLIRFRSSPAPPPAPPCLYIAVLPLSLSSPGSAGSRSPPLSHTHTGRAIGRRRGASDGRVRVCTRGGGRRGLGRARALGQGGRDTLRILRGWAGGNA